MSLRAAASSVTRGEHALVVAQVASWAMDHGYRVRGVVRSPLLGTRR